jgi:hypothetical protein
VRGHWVHLIPHHHIPHGFVYCPHDLGWQRHCKLGRSGSHILCALKIHMKLHHSVKLLDLLAVNHDSALDGAKRQVCDPIFKVSGSSLVAQAPWEDPWTRTLWQKDQQKTNKSSATVAELASTITNVSASVLAISELTAVTTKQTSAEEGGANDNDSKKTMTPHGEETMVTLCLLATRSARLRNKKTDPIGAIPCLHSAQLNSQLTLDNILLTIVLKFIPMVK